MGIDDTARFVLLFEGVSSNIQLLAEGHHVLVEGQRALAEGQRTLTERVDGIAMNVAVLKKDMWVVKDHLGINGGPLPSRTPKRRKKA